MSEQTPAERVSLPAKDDVRAASPPNTVIEKSTLNGNQKKGDVTLSDQANVRKSKSKKPGKASNDTTTNGYTEPKKVANDKKPKEKKGQKKKGTAKPSASDQEVILRRWYIKLLSGNKTPASVQVEGWKPKSSPTDTEEYHWHSSIIVTRESPTEVKTQSGTLYRLEGQMDIDCVECKREEWSEEILKQFKYGFPTNWQELLNAEAEKLPKSSSKKKKKEKAFRSTWRKPCQTAKIDRSLENWKNKRRECTVRKPSAH